MSTTITAFEKSITETIGEFDASVKIEYKIAGFWNRRYITVYQYTTPNENGVWTWGKPSINKSTGGQTVEYTYEDEANVAAALLDAVEECKRLDQRTGKEV